MTDKEKIIEHINRIDQLSRQPGNGWLLDELRKRFGSENRVQNSAISTSIAEDIAFIRFALNIQAKNSVNYNFVSHQRLKAQLDIDNLRMENSALDLKADEEVRFYNYCVNAFYQIENLLNYYYYVTYPRISDFLREIEICTCQELEKFRFQRKGDETSIGDVSAYYKLNAFCNSTGVSWSEKNTLNYIRRVRNEGEHRNTVSNTPANGNEKFESFLKEKDRTKVLLGVKLISNKVAQYIGKPMCDTIVEGTITSMLPAECYFSIAGGSPQRLYDVFFNKTRGLNVNDKIRITFHGHCIVNVEH
jgi:hypothetical protein